jgi:hypothetical protein
MHLENSFKLDLIFYIHPLPLGKLSEVFILTKRADLSICPCDGVEKKYTTIAIDFELLYYLEKPAQADRIVACHLNCRSLLLGWGTKTE